MSARNARSETERKIVRRKVRKGGEGRKGNIAERRRVGHMLRPLPAALYPYICINICLCVRIYKCESRIPQGHWFPRTRHAVSVP